MKRPPKSRVLEELKAAAPQAVEAAVQAAAQMTSPAVSAPEIPREPDAPLPPADWSKGALLNVRVAGAEYVVTLYPEEFDPQHPERALRFGNPALCQDFVSRWYARQHHDPRAMR